MNKFCKILVSIVCSIAILSTSALLADSEKRKEIVDELDGLLVNSGTVVDFLYDLCNQHRFDLNRSDLNRSDFQLLFEYVEYKRSILSYDFAVDLREKKLNGEKDAPSERLAHTFNLLKQIIDDYNEENKTNCFKACCKKSCICGCFVSWCRENGKSKVAFTLKNVVVLLDALSSKGTILRTPEAIADCVETALIRLSANPID